MNSGSTLITGASAVAIDGRALILEGPPGAGKSSLALALIDRGAQLIGDDGVAVTCAGDRVLASPPQNIAGLMEIRGVGIVAMPTVQSVPVALILTLSDDAERLPSDLLTRNMLGCEIPVLAFAPGTIAPAVRAEWALREHGLSFD